MSLSFTFLFQANKFSKIAPTPINNFKFNHSLGLLRHISFTSGTRARSTMSRYLEHKVQVSVCQMTSTADKSANLVVASNLIRVASANKSEMVFLPECTDYIAQDKNQAAKLSETLDGPFITTLRQLAKKHGIWVSVGGFHERRSSLRPDGFPWMSNTHVLLNNHGEISSCYRKVHLFNVSPGVLGRRVRGLREADSILPGDEIVKPTITPIGNLGLGICYDLRFPEFSLILRSQNADCLTFPSAFTVPTGSAHWESLIRARAIENQCFVIAAAQVGQHNPDRSSYGHAMVVDPWGEVLKEASDDESIFHIDIDVDTIEDIRMRIEVYSHKRTDVYKKSLEKFGRISLTKDKESAEKTRKIKRFYMPKQEGSFQFSVHSVRKAMSFLESEYSVAFVNKKCVLPGHVLVISKRPAIRLPDLSAEETADLFELVKIVQRLVESVYHSKSSTVTIQDGPEAGQTVQHVHVHVIPRHPMDFSNNDSIYEKLDNHDKGEDIKWRSETEMSEEASMFRDHLIRFFSDELLLPKPTAKQENTR